MLKLVLLAAFAAGLAGIGLAQAAPTTEETQVRVNVFWDHNQDAVRQRGDKALGGLVVVLRDSNEARPQFSEAGITGRQGRISWTVRAGIENPQVTTMMLCTPDGVTPRFVFEGGRRVTGRLSGDSHVFVYDSCVDIGPLATGTYDVPMVKRKR